MNDKSLIRSPLDEWEQAEVGRVDAIKERMERFQHIPLPCIHSEILSNNINVIASLEVDESFSEFRDEAQAAKEACLYRLTQARDAAIHREAEAARARIHAEVVEDLDQFEVECTNDVVEAIAAGKIRHLYIKY